MSIIHRLKGKQVLSRFILRNHYYSAEMQKKAVAFTFDDGPSPHTTRQLVDAFAMYQGKCSFFFQGNHAEAHPEIVQYAHAAGCTVGNHSYDHPLFANCGSKEMLRQIRKTNRILAEITGEQPRFLRPPAHRFTQWQALLIRLVVNMPIVQANIAPMDWVWNSAETMADFLQESLHPGAIVCLHDASVTTLYAIELVLPRLQREGYAFVSLDEIAAAGRFSPYRKIIVQNLKA